MTTLRWHAPAVLAAALLAGGCSVAAAAEDEGKDLKPAMRAAEAWLQIVDSGRYGDSWDASSRLFKDTIARTRWEVQVQGVREALGVVAARKLRSATYTTTLPGAPDGEYVVIQYNTQFEKRPLSVETVTPMREKDGSWRVSGYFIR